MSPTSGSPPSGVAIIRLEADVPLIEAAPLVGVRHLVGQNLMLRVLEIGEASSLEIDEPEQEHIVTVLSGQATLSQGDRHWTVGAESVALIRTGQGFTLSALDGALKCQIVSTPPNVDLVRHLLHLEHADHGFD
ncbi:MAG: hypothetical protein JWR85_3170 [Marmoricola sp.]|nr:hypothetical protein [Marmoricola sp.]